MTDLFQGYTPGEPRPQLALPVQRVICATHGEPFKPGWPGGYATFVTLALEALKECHAFLNSVDGSTESIEAALDVRPMCCVIADHSPDLLKTLYDRVNNTTTVGGAAPLWRAGMCGKCHKLAHGAPWNPAVNPVGVMMGGGVTIYKHLCFTCHSQPTATRGPGTPRKRRTR